MALPTLLRALVAYSSLLVGLLVLTQCQKHEPAPSLPPESTTGANKSGCLVDGQILVPRDAQGRSGTDLAFQVGTTADGSTFSLGISDLKDSTGPSIYLMADSLVLTEGQTYAIAFSPHRGVVQATCFTADGVYRTTQPTAGTLTITKLDRQTNLIAGRFEFRATNLTTGRQVTITQGRFDYKHN